MVTELVRGQGTNRKGDGEEKDHERRLVLWRLSSG